MADDDKNNDDSKGKGDDKGKGYTPPATQEDLDRIINQRLARVRSEHGDIDELRAKAEKWDKAEAENRSEIDNLKVQLQESQSKLEKYEHRDQTSAWAKEVAKDSHIDPGLLRGSTREELEEHFTALKAIIPAPAGAAPAGKQGLDGQPAGHSGEDKSADDVLAELYPDKK